MSWELELHAKLGQDSGRYDLHWGQTKYLV